MIRRPTRSTLFPYTTLSRSERRHDLDPLILPEHRQPVVLAEVQSVRGDADDQPVAQGAGALEDSQVTDVEDRKSTRLNSSHANISYAVFCLKKNTNLL